MIFSLYLSNIDQIPSYIIITPYTTEKKFNM